MSNLSQRFNNLSLYKKILLILSTTLLFVFFAFVVGIQLLSHNYYRDENDVHYVPKRTLADELLN